MPMTLSGERVEAGMSLVRESRREPPGNEEVPAQAKDAGSMVPFMQTSCDAEAVKPCRHTAVQLLPDGMLPPSWQTEAPTFRMPAGATQGASLQLKVSGLSTPLLQRSPVVLGT